MAQDASGVVFRAFDQETNQAVAVRRFFPFGVNGGGLSGEEQADYEIAVERLTDISHPAMRAIIGGGCDPVDGMPFIATEWIEGASLQSFIERGPLSPAEARQVLALALEVCWQISHVFGEEAVWVETDIHTIIFGAEGSGRGATFWISPLKWLGKNDGQHGWDSIICLTEDMMGWRGKTILDHEGDGLGAWMKSLRGHDGRVSLSEAWETLPDGNSIKSPQTVRRLVRKPVPMTAGKQRKKKSSAPAYLLALAALAVVSFGGWILVKRNDSQRPNTSTSEQVVGAVENLPSPEPQAPSTEPVEPTESTALFRESRPRTVTRTPEQVSQAAAEFSSAARMASEEDAALEAAQKAEIEKRNGVFTVEDSELLMDRSIKNATLEGVLENVRRTGNGSGKTIYLYFSDDGDKSTARGGIEVSKAQGDLAVSVIDGLKGKKIRINGTIRRDGFGTFKYPVVMIERRNAIEEVE